MDYYVVTFSEMDDARQVRSRLRDAYSRRGNPTEIKLIQKSVTVPETALPTLENIAVKLQADYKVSKIKKSCPDR